MNGPVHRYMESSPACWARYGELLARGYADFRYMAAHQLAVDAYAVQHPGRPSPQSTQSVGVHLVSLCAVLEQGLPVAQAAALLKRCADTGGFEWLPPPAERGALTVLHPLAAPTPETHAQRVREWAHACWSAWSPHHDRVREWLAAKGGVGSF